MANRPPIADQAARDRVVQSRGANLWVEAGAGTGKTTLLVARILSVLTDPTRPLSLARLAAITFTEKAAGELKVKLRQEIEKALPGATDRRRDALATALRDLETAAIDTLHSFARSLLTELPVEAGIDPQAPVLDEGQFSDLLAEAYDEWFDEQNRAAPPDPALAWFLRERELYERRGDHDWLWKLASAICLNHDVLLDAEFPAPFSLGAAVAQLREAAQAAVDYARANCVKTDDDAFVQTTAFARATAGLPDPADREGCLAALAALPAFNLQKGSGKSWRSGDKEESKAMRQALRARVDAIRRVAHDPEARALYELARRFGQRFEEIKRRRATLGFQDLLVQAVRLLRENKAARAYFQDRYDALLIDEFQDTDPLQVEIAFFLCEDGAHADRAADVRLAPGKLMVVGDPKQSIYRFRRADIEVYERTKRQLLGAGDPEQITVNFRCAPGIIETVNRVFEPLMRHDPALPVSPRYEPLTAGRGDVPPDAGVTLLQADASFASAAEAGAAEAAAVAQWIAQAHAAARPVFDKEAGRRRPLQWRDVAILSRRTTEFARLETALRNAAVPYRIEGGKVFFQREEIAAVVQGLLALEDADDSAALAQWLGGDLVGFSDADLLRHVLARPSRRLSFFDDADQPGDEISRVLAQLRALHVKRNRVGCLATTRALLDLVGALPTAFTFPRREVAVANLHKALEAARAADRANQTFGEFARAWADAYAEEREEADYAITEDADDVVRVLTIHKAKGLDWPVVVLVDLAAKPRAAGGPRPLHRRAGGQLALHLADQRETSNYADAAEIEQQFEQAERVRQLYVAMTRARDYLVMPLFGGVRTRGGKIGAPGGYLAFLQQAGMIDAEQRIVDAMGARVETVAVAALESPEAPRWDLPHEFAARELTPAAKAEVERLLAARAARPPEPPAAPALAFESPSKREGELPPTAARGAGKRMGLAFHAVMETLPLDDRGQWPRTIEGVARQYELAPKDAALLRRWLDNFAALPCFTQLAGARVWRETPFTWTDAQGVSFSGKLDLLAETPGGLLILDYKTDRVTKEELAARVDFYRPQALIYRDAMRGLLKRDEVRTVLCFVELGQEVDAG